MTLRQEASNERHGDGVRARRVAEVVAEARTAAVESVAGRGARLPAAERNVRSRHQAVCVRRVEAGRPTVVHGAIPATRVPVAGGTIHDHDVSSHVRGRAVDEGNLCVGGGEPGEDVGRGRESLRSCGKLV